jgi:hypothetical protein
MRWELAQPAGLGGTIHAEQPLGTIAETKECEMNSDSNSVEQEASPFGAQDAVTAVENSLAAARLDFKRKGEVVRAELMRTVRDQTALDAAYDEWKQAKATMFAIADDLKVLQAGLPAEDAA